MNCLLCHKDSNPFELDTYLCSECGLVFKNPETFNSDEKDFERYSTHNNNSSDQGYLDFLGKFVNPLKLFVPESFNALDFGCGPGPTLSLLLEKIGGVTFNYDPLFYPDAQLLIPEYYDVVVSTEVVEHFKTPRHDWQTLIDLVKNNGIIAIMTLFYSPEIDYKKWWYKNDHTHIVFYQQKTLEFLAREFNLEILYNDKKSIIIFKKVGNEC